MTRCPRCGAEPRRSTPQNNRYHALMRAAFHHWPQSHRFQPRNREHLRKWLQVMAGHKVTKRIDAPKGLTVSALKDFVTLLFKNTADHVFATVMYAKSTGEPIAVELDISKSTRFEMLGHREACKLFDDISQIIEAETGLKADALLKEEEKAA
jgi:hypothetical protein